MNGLKFFIRCPDPGIGA